MIRPTYKLGNLERRPAAGLAVQLISGTQLKKWGNQKEKMLLSTYLIDSLLIRSFFCYGVAMTATNVALRKSANQSSTARGGSAMNAIDGDRSVFHDVGGTGGRCSETSKEASPWWMADLMRPTAVNAVRVTTRTCCGTVKSHFPFWYISTRLNLHIT